MRLIASLVIAVLMATSAARAQGDLLEARESLYNNIYVRQNGNMVIMQFGKNKRFWTESVYDTSDNRVLPLRYSKFMAFTITYPEKLDSILEIGLGGGRVASYLHLYMPEVPIHSVELDPDVVDLARTHFDVETDDIFQITALDGRIHLMRDKTMHDLIMVDAYRGPFVPFHLTTREFYLTAKKRLSPGGVLAQNIEPTTMLFDAAIATLSGSFDNVDLYPAAGNVIAIAYDGPRRDHGKLRERAEALQAQYDFRYELPEILAERRLLTQPPDHEPLVDDFAPVEMLKSIERHNQGVDDISTPAE